MLDFSLFDTRLHSIRRDPRNPLCAECLETPVRTHRAPMQPRVFHVPSSKFYSERNGLIYVVRLQGKTACCSCPRGQHMPRGMSTDCWHARRAWLMAKGREVQPVRPYHISWQTEWELFSGDELVVDRGTNATQEREPEPAPRRADLESLYEYRIAS